MKSEKRVVVIGAGLAGTELSLTLADAGVKVFVYESKRVKRNPAQKTNFFAELVCTNSLKSMNPHSAHGALKTEMQELGSKILKVANNNAIPAGDALAVDRESFSQEITSLISNHSNIEVFDEVVDDPEVVKNRHEADALVIATGPLTMGKLEDWLQENLSPDDLYFYDAIAPVVDADSLDFSKMYFKDRHIDPSEKADYLNIPLSKEAYYEFVSEIKHADKVPAQNFEKEKFFESCLPVDVMASRGDDTLRYSCMKPLGLENEDGEIAYAVIQLRKENLLGSAFNMVGFQNRLKYSEQVRIFKTLPGFENASFIHLGSVHRNTFINSSEQLDFSLNSKKFPWLYFAGQVTGVEGYTESAAMGLYLAWQLNQKFNELEVKPWPVETIIGSLINYIMTAKKPAPSNANFGLVPPVVLTKEQRKMRDKKRVRKELIVNRANQAFSNLMESYKS